jgi:hypothetical protein
MTATDGVAGVLAVAIGVVIRAVLKLRDRVTRLEALDERDASSRRYPKE